MAQKPGLCTDSIKDPQPLPLQMLSQPLSHPLAGQSPQYRGSAAGNFPSITTITHKAQLRWAGHVSRMPDNRIPKQLFSGELSHGKCKGENASRTVSLKDFNISTESWESLASDRPCWRHLITKGANTTEECRTLQAEQKRAGHKARANSTTSTTPAHYCPTCGRGFISHLWTHRNSCTN